MANGKKMTIQLAVEEFEAYDLYRDVIESYAQELEDPSLVSDLYDLIDEYEEEFEFYPDSEGDFSDSFERNLREAVNAIVEENEDIAFIDDAYVPDDIPDLLEDGFEQDDTGLDMDIDLGSDDDLDEY
jgi:predicted DNA-binding protein